MLGAETTDMKETLPTLEDVTLKCAYRPLCVGPGKHLSPLSHLLLMPELSQCASVLTTSLKTCVEVQRIIFKSYFSDTMILLPF